MSETVQCPDCDGIQFIIRKEKSSIDVRDLGPMEYIAHTTECANCGFQFVTPEQARDHDRQLRKPAQLIVIEPPYITTYVVGEEKLYNPRYGDDRMCICGHKYYRHFDTYEGMRNVGCKYCICAEFREG